MFLQNVAPNDTICTKSHDMLLFSQTELQHIMSCQVVERNNSACISRVKQSKMSPMFDSEKGPIHSKLNCAV